MRELSLEQSLIEGRIITPEQLEQARQVQQATRQRDLLHVIVDLGFTKEAEAAQAKAATSGLLYINLARFTIDRGAIGVLPYHVAAHHNVIPIQRFGRLLTVATADPGNVLAEDDVRLASGLRIQWVIAAAGAIREAIARHYGVDESEDEGADIYDLDMYDKHAGDPPPIVRIAHSIIQRALGDGAQEIHLVPDAGDLRIYYLMHGVIQEMMKLPRHCHVGLVSVYKRMVEMSPAEVASSQHGRTEITHELKEYVLHVQTLPTAFGEKVTLILFSDSGRS
jgi:type IV pilus assembly protein PilB